MLRDSVVEEVRAAREALAKHYGHDIDAIVRALLEAPATAEREFV